MTPIGSRVSVLPPLYTGTATWRTPHEAVCYHDFHMRYLGRRSVPGLS